MERNAGGRWVGWGKNDTRYLTASETSENSLERRSSSDSARKSLPILWLEARRQKLACIGQFAPLVQWLPWLVASVFYNSLYADCLQKNSKEATTPRLPPECHSLQSRVGKALVGTTLLPSQSDCQGKKSNRSNSIPCQPPRLCGHPHGRDAGMRK